MDLEESNYYRDLQSVLYNDCKKYLNYHVILTMNDGSKLDGIIEEVDTNRVVILVGEDIMEQEKDNQPGYQRQPIGYGPPRRRFRRFRPRPFPFNQLAAIALLQYPYIMPPYPYYPYYGY